MRLKYCFSYAYVLKGWSPYVVVVFCCTIMVNSKLKHGHIYVYKINAEVESLVSYECGYRGWDSCNELVPNIG